VKIALQKDDVAYCRRIAKRFGKSYAFATAFFSKEARDATYILYAFFRIPDEIVDMEPQASVQAKREKLHAWRTAWKGAYEGTLGGIRGDWLPVLRGTAVVFHTYAIPFAYSEAFLDAMEQDLVKETYATYQELEGYMYGSAAVVGLMMSYVIGFKSGALEYAEKLGYAMQLTNFLRDVQEDSDERSRIYLPEESMRRFGVTAEEIHAHTWSIRMRALMQYEIARARALYRDADAGILLLHHRGRFAVRIASVLYEAILYKLEQQGLNPFLGRARTMWYEKIILLIKNFVKII
jgi:15-cis-phytoene synthase